MYLISLAIYVPCRKLLCFEHVRSHVGWQVVDLVWDQNMISRLDFHKVAKINELGIQNHLFLRIDFNDDVLSAQVAIHRSRLGYIFQQRANFQYDLSELLLAVALIQDFIEQVVLQLVCLDHLLGIKLDVPEQFLEAVVVLEIGLGLVDHPDVKIGRLVDHLLNLED